MQTKTCLYYITLQCNDTCEFCHIWSDENLSKIEDAPVEKHIENLSLARKAGASILEITGGEPLLYNDLGKFIEKARRLDFAIKLLTNGLLYRERYNQIKGLADETIFSLDYPTKEDHDRSRGVEMFSDAISAIQFAVSKNEKTAVNFTLTRDSIRFLPEMVDLCRTLKVHLYVHHAYNYDAHLGFEKISYDYIKYFYKKPSVSINLSEFEFLKDNGNKIIFPRCKARQTTITFLPDGSQAAPCFYNNGGRQGREPVCFGCTRYPYMLPSFAQGFDKYRFLDWYSKWITSRKEKKI